MHTVIFSIIIFDDESVSKVQSLNSLFRICSPTSTSGSQLPVAHMNVSFKDTGSINHTFVTFQLNWNKAIFLKVWENIRMTNT
jgi:hypothetical protein